METFNIEILNPKAKKLLMDLADLRLISISESVSNPFLDAVKRIRSKNAQLSLSDITKEVENIRSKRNGK
jgi:anti-anti-sigma regulatory factor